MLNTDIYIYIFPFDVTRSSPVLYHEYCIQDGNLLPTFSLLLLTLLLPIFTTHALLPIFLEEPWVLEWIWIRADTQIRFENGYLWAWKFLNQERSSCGFKNTQIRVEGAWMNELDGLPSSEPFLSGIQANDQAPQRAYPPQVHQCKVYKWYLR